MMRPLCFAMLALTAAPVAAAEPNPYVRDALRDLLDPQTPNVKRLRLRDFFVEATPSDVVPQLLGAFAEVDRKRGPLDEFGGLAVARFEDVPPERKGSMALEEIWNYYVWQKNPGAAEDIGRALADALAAQPTERNLTRILIAMENCFASECEEPLAALARDDRGPAGQAAASVLRRHLPAKYPK